MQPIKWHGGKHYLAKALIALFPPHLTYCEPFAGGLAVLLEKPLGAETVNDLDGELTTFWRVLASPELFGGLCRLLDATPFSEEVFESRDRRSAALANEYPEEVARAWRFFIGCRQSLAGRQRSFTAVTTTRVRRGMQEQVSAWLTAVEGLPEVHARLRRVLILNRPAIEVIRKMDAPGNLFYCDPPYLHATRTAPQVYAHEMTERDHRELLSVLLACDSKVVLSGYPSELYDATLAHWRHVDFDLPNNAAGGASKRRMVERVWLNYDAE